MTTTNQEVRTLQRLPGGWSLSGLFTRSLADRLMLALLMGVGLGLMGLWMGPLYQSMGDSLQRMAATLPGGSMEIFADIATPDGFITAEIFSIFGPALLIYVALASAARAFAGEMESRSLDLLMSNPVGIGRVTAAKTLAMMSHVGIVAVLTGVGVAAGNAVSDLGIPVMNIVAVTLSFWLLGVVAGMVAELLSVLTARRVIAMVGSAGVMLVAYVWGVFLPLSESMAGWAKISPWYWYSGPNPLGNGFDWGYVASFIVVIALLWAATAWLLRKRDLVG